MQHTVQRGGIWTELVNGLFWMEHAFGLPFPVRARYAMGMTHIKQ